MPKIISYTPPWLSRPEPGFHIFDGPQSTLSSPYREHKGSGPLSNANIDRPYLGAKKTVARRGTEIFVAADNKIRWADLCMLKDDYTEKEWARKHDIDSQGSKKDAESDDSGKEKAHQTATGFRELHLNISERIRQLSLSPNGNLLAVVTSHTVHIATLPHPSKLGQDDNKPIKLKTKMVAPTTHVLSQSPIASALWHPFGVGGSCFVTITADAIIRLWECNFRDYMSFGTPSLAIDLKKLAVGRSTDEDFTPNRSNANRSFSLDSVGMEVASACFGGSGSSDESPWCAMTLWIAMTEGDVYALCPLLPSKWQPSSTTLPSLSAQAVSKMAFMQDGSAAPEEMQQCNDQYQWITDLDGQEPYLKHDGSMPDAEVYCRPSKPSPTPKLQGPFQIFGDEYNENPEISDIHVIPATMDAEDLMDGEGSDNDSGLGMDEETGLAASIVCLVTRTGRVNICLDIDGVQSQWLPKRRNPAFTIPDDPSLVLLEVVDTMRPDHAQETEWPTFSIDVNSQHSFFVTHSQGVFYLSLEAWIQSLQSELQSTASTGTEFRVEILTDGPETLRERILDLQDDEFSNHEPTAAVVFQDSDLGYFLLTADNGVPHGVILDKPDATVENELRVQTTYDLPQEMSTPALGPARQPYVPPPSLWAQSTLPQFFNSHVQNRHKKALKDEIRLSSATLDLMTQAHRVLSEETHTLGISAADLFRRCERLQDELREQIERVKEISRRKEEVVGIASEADDSDDKPRATVERRLQDAQARQEKLTARFENLSMNVRKCNSKPYSDHEKALLAEVDKISRSVLEPDEKPDDEEQYSSALWYRYDEAQRLVADMVPRAKETFDNSVKEDDDQKEKIPPDLRKAKVGQVMNLLERESALVDAAQERLERLSLATVS